MSAVWIFLLCSYILSVYSECLSSTICDVTLSKRDFKHGTYRIKESGTYCLLQDIKFNPLPSSNEVKKPNSKFNWFPRSNEKFPGSTTLKDGGFALGFFATISIETDNVK